MALFLQAFAIDASVYAPMEATYSRLKLPVPPHEYELARFTGHSGRIDAIAIHPDGSSMASGARDFNIFLWSLDKLASAAVSTTSPVAGAISSREPSEIPVLSPVAVSCGAGGGGATAVAPGVAGCAFVWMISRCH